MAAIFVLSLVLRLFLLNKFPVGITHDELNYILAAKSIFYTGSFVPQTSPALLSGGADSIGVIAEIPAFVLSLFVGLAKFNLFNARIMGAIFSSLSAAVLYKLVSALTKKRIYGVAAGVIWAINPWSFLMGRTVFEVNFFDFFFLLGFLVLIKTKGYKIFLSLPFYILGFLSYTGGQVAFYLFIILTLLFHYLQTKAINLKPYLIYFSVITFILGGYIFIITHNQSMATRGGELYLPTNTEISKQVDDERLLGVPSGINNLFINKATIYAKGFFEKYLSAFSVDTLFLNGEFRAAFSYQKHGTFYLVDIIFVLIGLGVLFGLSKKLWIFVVLAIAIAPLTSGLSVVEHSYSQRAGLLYPFLIILVGIGIGYCIEIAKRDRKFLIGLLITAVYLVSFASLIHLYFYRFPIYASDGWFFQDRTISRYIGLTEFMSKDRKIVVITFEPKIVFEEYLFYSGGYQSKSEIESINAKIFKSDYSLKNVTFTNKCPEPKDLADNTTWIYDPLSGCGENKNGKLRVTRFRDIYEQYLIENDLVCRKFELGSYVSPEAFKNFDLENQTSLKFCQSWITKI